MKRNLLIIVILCCAVGSYAQSTPSSYQFSLEDCLHFAFGNNYDRKAMELNHESSHVSYQQSKNMRLPNLNASLGERFTHNADGSTFVGDIGMNSSVVIYQGGYLNQSIEASEIAVERAAFEMQQFDNELVVNILRSFLSVLQYEELLKYQNVVLASSQEQLKQGRMRYNVGSLLESDYLLLEAQYYSDSNNVVETRINRDNSLLALKVYLSMDPISQLTIVSPEEDNMEGLASTMPSLDEALDQAMSYLPTLKMSLADIEKAACNIKMAKSSYYPTISANAAVNTGHYNFDMVGEQLSTGINQQVGISMSIPIYDRGQVRGNVRKTEIAYEQSQNDYQQKQLNVKQLLVQEYYNVTAAYNTYRVTKMRSEAYLKSYQAYEEQFKHGAITAVDLLQQQNNYISALNEYIKSKYVFLLERKVLDVYMGKSIYL